MWKLSGRDGYEGFNASKSSPAGRRRAFNQGAGLPVCLIEGDREESKDAKKGAFNFDELKDLYNGRSTGTLGIAKRGYQTEEPLFKASIMIAQNETVDGSQALLSRIVHCHVTKEHHTPDLLPLARKFEQYTAHDVAGYMRHVLKHEKQFLDLYLSEFANAEAELIASNTIKELRIIKCHAQVYAAAVGLSLFFPQITPQTLLDFKDYLWGRARNRQGRMISDHPMVAEFWETFHFLNIPKGNNESDAWDDPNDQVLNHHKDADAGWVAVNLNEYAKACRDYGQEKPDLTRLKKLLPGSTRYEYIDNKKMGSAIDQKVRHCWIFREKK